MTAIITFVSSDFLKEIKEETSQGLQLANGRAGHGIYNPWLFC